MSKTYFGETSYVSVGTMPPDSAKLLMLARKIFGDNFSTVESLDENRVKELSPPYAKQFVEEEGYPPHLRPAAEQGVLDMLVEHVLSLHYQRRSRQ